MDQPASLSRLQTELQGFSELAIAVSGGVDSMTLAWVAAAMPGLRVQMVHAVSPAVPAAATERVQRYAERANWNLTLVDAGEYSDPAYKSNPVDRCYYCKNNLYARIRQVTKVPIAAGTNLDDLGDYRPGLKAAGEHEVHHPFVAAQIDKAAVRGIAAYYQLLDIAELPAQPCLASRVETGIAIDAADLKFVNEVETVVAALVGAGDIRCRITAKGVRLELPPELVKDTAQGLQVDQLVTSLCAAQSRHYAGHSDYKKGSAFLIEKIAVRSRRT